MGLIRNKYSIPSRKTNGKRPEELTVKEICERFEISKDVVYYWINWGILNARRIDNGAPYWIALDSEKEEELRQKIVQSIKIQKIKNNNKLKKPY